MCLAPEAGGLLIKPNGFTVQPKGLNFKAELQPQWQEESVLSGGQKASLYDNWRMWSGLILSLVNTGLWTLGLGQKNKFHSPLLVVLEFIVS